MISDCQGLEHLCYLIGNGMIEALYHISYLIDKVLIEVL